MTQPDESETIRQAGAVARIQDVLRAAADRDLIDPRAAMAEMNELAAEFSDVPQVRTLAEAALSGLGLAAGLPIGDTSTIRAALANLGELAADDPDVAPMLAMMPNYLDALLVQQDGDTETALAMLSDMLAQAGDLQPGNPLREAMAEVAPMLAAMRAAADEEHPKVPVAGPGSTDAMRAFHLVARGGMAMRQGAEKDLTKIDAGIKDLRAAVTLTPDDHPDHVFQLASLALGLTHRAEVGGSLADVNEAITVLEEARKLAGGAAHPHWSFVNTMLAELRQRRGEAAPHRLAALEGLRGYTWRVLLQPDPASARAVARGAAEEAIASARRCLVAHQPADALRALDAGRGLMLFAATELRDPYTRLTEAGHRDLAAQWSATKHPPPLLREQVLEVLVGDTGLLDPPDLDEVQDALRQLGVDALVYLVPAEPPAPGWAVIAPAEGPPRYLALPHLAIEEGTDVERYLTAMASRGAGLVREVELVDSDQFAGSIDALCGWAWKAAMGPLLKPYLGAERVPRLVLIPMGDLARVPWQAARSPDGTYAVERVALSQAASARMLCATAAAEPVRLTSGGMVLADPDTGGRAVDLHSARLEAYAIHQVFYPGATYVGRRPDGNVSRSGAGTADDVRSWLRADGGQAGTMLHLASHGVMETARVSASSRLCLAGGDLTADELIDAMTKADRHPVGLVVLAACHTGRSIHGYDEAYSLGTMFLAAGARSVLSTQWSIPDQDTSLLMYMLHHFLVIEHCSPWDALRRAQMWMLDGDRRAPQHMPVPLRRMLEKTEPARVVSWAGFVHWGQ
ncbi:CHAT domain-containing protein [Micromonospora sp. NPDC050784]|uniref:CHAT domain-containing protein n=1 Tax=Micromonospora sp. NPDC050784 TaxID=3364281 RepID=UPI00379E12B4